MEKTNCCKVEIVYSCNDYRLASEPTLCGHYEGSGEVCGHRFSGGICDSIPAHLKAEPKGEVASLRAKITELEGERDGLIQVVDDILAGFKESMIPGFARTVSAIIVDTLKACPHWTPKGDDDGT